jgi:hypothetical protein
MYMNVIDSSNHLIGLRHMPSLRCMVEVLGHRDGQTPRSHRAAQAQKQILRLAASPRAGIRRRLKSAIADWRRDRVVVHPGAL